MPYSFTKIEEDKSRTIGFVFSFLIVVYFIVVWLIALLAVNFFSFQSSARTFTFSFTALNLGHTLVILGLAMILGYVHWTYTTSNLIEKILGVLKADPLNTQDHYHQTFRNIVDEVSVATGGRKMEAVVVPTMAMNAFAVADFSGRAVIGVTEGLLARLTRAQLEAVVGHEAAHIVSGDCLATTVTSSLFELFNGMLRGLEAVFRGGGSRRGPAIRFSGRGAGGAIAFLVLIYLLLSLTRFLSQVVRLFVSRERESRADAVAVRLTRDPLSLAEALYAIAYRWRGGGLPAQELESIFIVNPVHSVLDEGNSLFSSMFSTHPPMGKRMGILLDMAHSDVELVIEDVEHQAQKPRTEVPEVGGSSSTRWVIHKDGAWQGPFTLAQIRLFDWLKPEMWIQRLDGKKVQMAYQDKEVHTVLAKTEKGGPPGANECPRCALPLSVVSYEGVEVEKCAACRGALVSERDVQRIIIRQEVGFSDRIKKIAEGIERESRNPNFQVINRAPETLFKCPKCANDRARMMRMFYTEAYHVEIDKCFTCGRVWFDGDELEVLQYLVERSVDRMNKSET